MPTPKILTAFFAALFLSVMAVGQDRPTITYEAPADTALIQFNISAQADTAKAAYEQASKEAERTRQILRANGIEPKTAEIGYYSIQPVYDWKNPKRKLVGYNVTTSVSVKLKDFSKVGPITQQLADADVSQSQSVNYTLENIDEAKSKAVEDAYRHARAALETVARASGRALGELSYASVDTFENVRPMPMKARGMAMEMRTNVAPTEEFTPQNVLITAHVNAMFTLK
ncbi:MAG: hypothetical protein DMG75_06815 [Acidobacteria bacterium]|nr:MAG: hypothetical protein DMG75_06815 [Acidobacteriota bacterium]